jgi:energy-coupling factor transport system ATP-binding protein
MLSGLLEWKNTKKPPPHLLSGGQKQRVAIAGALAMQPEYLVMDEATAMLDPQGRKEVLATLSRLNKELGLNGYLYYPILWRKLRLLIGLL